MTSLVDPSDLRTHLGAAGVWLGSFSEASAREVREAAAGIEELGYSALWTPEVPFGREALTQAALLLSATRNLRVATGIANIYVRDAVAAANGARTLAEAWDDRFVLGLGVSHAPLVTSRGHDYSRPLAYMRAYLDAMDESTFGPAVPAQPPRLLAALRRGMLELAANRAQGAHTYFVTPEHTARARQTLGAGPVLAVEQAVVVDTDPARARRTARDYAAFYLQMPNYTNNLRELGFSDEDFADGGSDALIDAVIPWGDPDTLARTFRAHYEAGADHVCVQPLAGTLDAQMESLRRLAPILVA
ncbi:TIGR03620 family F420-dependent LLM class oxidoreductase [Microbispora sp. RL4-1S]|uniref:TIGR03620 family F420-dependent LLM class oxidoreductase n=1 Tax=Microbispora oryzae TaxID=2806554 RepID=A0A940WKV1_9ACTN|nr:TIGR03620 family F420-dependent LLM class oxidoreductase [Microbispora oryzae]MBP2707524.1 TIGR03620 family F420-dependent LLM class oxidoreductase [Microbispora oryzae]